MAIPRSTLLRTGAALAACLAVASSLHAQDGPTAAFDRYVKAERDFDLAALREVLAPDFVEVSPRGEVDERDAVLSFYAPEKKVQAPEYTVSEVKVRSHGTMAVVTALIVYSLPGGRDMRLRLGASAVQLGGGWQLSSAQYTGLPSKPASPPAPPAPPPAPKTNG